MADWLCLTAAAKCEMPNGILYNVDIWLVLAMDVGTDLLRKSIHQPTPSHPSIHPSVHPSINVHPIIHLEPTTDRLSPFSSDRIRRLAHLRDPPPQAPKGRPHLALLALLRQHRHEHHPRRRQHWRSDHNRLRLGLAMVPLRQRRRHHRRLPRRLPPVGYQEAPRRQDAERHLQLELHLPSRRSLAHEAQLSFIDGLLHDQLHARIVFGVGRAAPRGPDALRTVRRQRAEVWNGDAVGAAGGEAGDGRAAAVGEADADSQGGEECDWQGPVLGG